MSWAGVSLKRRTTHAIAMPGTATCFCMSGAMTGGKSREWRKMNSVASAMTGHNRTPISLHGCMTVVVTPRWQSSPRRTATVSFRIIWVHLFRLSTARGRWFGTVSLTSIEMCRNSEVRETSYHLGSKKCTSMKNQNFAMCDTDIIVVIQVLLTAKTR